MQFEWDPAKAESNRRKHGVTFEEAASVFFDPNGLAVPDAEHSSQEDRWVRIAMSVYARIVLVVHTERVRDGEEITRIISARKASNKEKRVYFGQR